MGILEDYCRRCRSHHPAGQHLPTWRVILAEHEDLDDWQFVRAVDPESAAERYVELWDRECWDYGSLDEPQRVVVQARDGSRRYFAVRGEQTIVYTTREVT